MQLLPLLWLLAVLGATLAFATQRARTLARPRRTTFAPAAGSERRGIRYALLEGMAPQAKESVRTHPATYVAGVLYHAGLGAAFVLTTLTVLKQSIPGGRLLGLLPLLGAIAGLGLLVRRLTAPLLRALSVPDDYCANLLTTGFTLAAALAAQGWLPPSWAQGCGMVLLVYAPLGKIRHCVFFFPTRLAFGRFFGRRGVLPPVA